MPKVLILTPSVRPLGARRSLVELLRALPAGWEPLVICPQNDGIALEIKDLGVPVDIVPQYPWRKAFGYLRAQLFQLPAIRRVARRFSPQIAHANEFHILPQTLKGIEKKCPVTAHVRLSISPRQIGNYGLNQANSIICVSRAVAELFPQPLASKVTVIHNGVSIEGLSAQGPPTAEPTLAGWLGESPRPLVVGLFGLISPRKNQMVAVEATAQALARGANVRLLLAGDAFQSTERYGDELRQRLAQPDLRGKVLWLPFQKDVAALYRSIDLNLLISNEEGFGRTIIEAGALAIPSVGTPIGGIPEIILPEETGLLIPEGDSTALADALLRLSNDEALRRRLGRNAQQRIYEHFTIEAHAQQMTRLWQSLIEK